MDRIILNQKIEVGKEVIIEGPPLEALRFQGGRAGNIITLTDSEGNDFRGRVIRLSEGEASIFVFDAFPSPTESSLEIILLQALPEKERMELIIQKATELGVSIIIPFKSQRSITLEEREAKQKKAHRWQEIAIKAVQQSRRAKVPKVEPYRSFKEALEFCEEEGLRILLWEKEGKSFKEVLKRYSTLNSPFDRQVSYPAIGGVGHHIKRSNISGKPRPSGEGLPKGGEGGFKTYRPKRVYVMVGPEGGLTETEVALAKEKGFVPVKLGQRILRTETAAITLIGILQYELGDL